MSAELAHALRGSLLRAAIGAVDDSGPMQTVDATTHAGTRRAKVEVALPYGLISHPPAGSHAVLLAMGGDQGDMVALPAACPSARFAAAMGEVGLCDYQGNRVHLRQGGVVEVHAASKVVVTVGGLTFSIGDGKVAITGGDLVVQGDISDRTGSLATMRGQYNQHANPDQGGAPPTPQMT